MDESFRAELVKNGFSNKEIQRVAIAYKASLPPHLDAKTIFEVLEPAMYRRRDKDE